VTHHASPAPGDPRSSSSSKSSAMRAVRGGHSIRTRTYVSCAAQSIESMTLMWATTLDRISESRACAQPYGTVLCGPLAYAEIRILMAPQPAPYRIARLTGKPKANLTLADVSAAPAPCPCPQDPGSPPTAGKRRAAKSPHLITGVITSSCPRNTVRPAGRPFSGSCRDGPDASPARGGTGHSRSAAG
jgi:hypothetical protein